MAVPGNVWRSGWREFMALNIHYTTNMGVTRNIMQIHLLIGACTLGDVQVLHKHRTTSKMKTTSKIKTTLEASSNNINHSRTVYSAINKFINT